MDVKKPGTGFSETRQLKRDATDLLYLNGATGIIVTVFAACVLVFAYLTPETQSIKLTWLGILTAIGGLRFADYWYWKSTLKNTKEYEPEWPRRRFCIGSFITGCMWGVYPLLQVDLISVTELTAIIVVLSAFSGGSTSVLSGSRNLAIAYSTVLLLPTSLYLVFSGSQVSVLGVLGTVATFVMVLTALKTAYFTRSAIIAKHTNKQLVEELDETNQEITRTNESLESKVEQRTQELYQLANLDPLTGLYNRTAFLNYLNKQLKEAQNQDQSRAILFIDLDGFKLLNDTSGHALGDQVLVHVAEILLQVAQSPEHVCRWGGDEFIVLLDDYTVEDYGDIAAALIDHISEAIEIAGGTFQIGATIGVALYPEHGISQEQLIANADTAMYVQKLRVPGYVSFFDQTMREQQDREQWLKNIMPSAITNDEFHLVYQPVINNQTGSVGFCEVLLRWHHNEEFISPVEFIPVAEKYGYINQLGLWVLRNACADAGAWHFDKEVDVSVNVSIAQLIYANIVPHVQQALKDNCLRPEQLHIEITESIFAENSQDVLMQVQALHDLGVKVSVDDFGTGFSSLKQLQDLNADVVKIDKTFVDTYHSGGRAIIQATQYMAKEFGYQVVVEGVETQEQAADLAQLGVNLSQGFYFCKPMPFEQLENWHKEFCEAPKVKKIHQRESQLEVN